MALIHRWPLTRGPEDVVGGLPTTNNGGVTFGPNGATFSGANWLACTKTWPNVFCVAGWVRTMPNSPRWLLGIGTAAGYCGAGIFVDTQLLLSAFGGTCKISHARDIRDGNLHMVVFRGYASGTNTWELWLDGASVGTVVAEGELDRNFAIGQMGAYQSVPLQGQCSDVRIYNYALSQAEIRALYAAGPSGESLCLMPTSLILQMLPVSATMGVE